MHKKEREPKVIRDQSGLLPDFSADVSAKAGERSPLEDGSSVLKDVAFCGGLDGPLPDGSDPSNTKVSNEMDMSSKARLEDIPSEKEISKEVTGIKVGNAFGTSPFSKKDLRKGRKAWKEGMFAGLRAAEGKEDEMIELLARKIKETEKIKKIAQNKI